MRHFRVDKRTVVVEENGFHGTHRKTILNDMENNLVYDCKRFLPHEKA